MYKQTHPIATKHIENKTYINDFVIGTSTDTEAITLFREMLQLTSHISLPLAKWTTNSKALQGVWKQENVPFREITQDSDAWPTKDFPSHSQPSVEVESWKIESRSFYVATTETFIDISRYSSYTKLLRVTAWILRFVHNCKSHLRIIHELNCNEIEKAKDYWIQTVQRQCFSAEINALKEERSLQKKSKISCFNPFLKDDYLRLGGRL
ncbi:uncharacterized protein NPIL_306741 [Nephila pilipes]|uniref:Uncharacterized protein n=1 Tax=Nephila pilipes TaxID=299642 RepID=A0A8X6MQC1_NEPPI|nr:uncharacterized protein NPIL_306741 [Nephila pilipes]